MQRSPPATRRHVDRLEDRLREEVKTYRRFLQKISRIKTKILCALREEGCAEAAELLHAPAREEGAVRCNTCIGCHTLRSIGPCASCPQCVEDRECVEHTRLCLAWRQPATTFIGGSVVTGVSSVCNIIEYDLSKYKDLMDKLGEASLEVEALLDEFPHGSQHHLQDRYNATRRTRDIHMEEEQLRVIETLLLRYQDQRRRLHDVLSDDEDDGNDAQEVHGGGIAPFGLMSNTQTHYQLGTQAPTGIPMEPRLEPGGSEPDDGGLGLGLGLPLGNQDMFRSILRSPTPPVSATRASSVDSSDPRFVGLPPPVAKEVRIQTPVTSQGGTPPVSPPRKEQPRNPAAPSNFATGGASPVGTVTSATTTTVTATWTRTTPSSSATMPQTPTPVKAASNVRRRSSSEGENEGSSLRQKEVERAQLFRTKQLVATRSLNLSQELDIMLDRLAETEDHSATWVRNELRTCEQQLKELEELESTAWTSIEKSEGRPAQKARIDKWRDWLCRQTDKTRKIKAWLWDASDRTTRRPREEHSTSCQRSVGHVEKVKLPTFSGRQEEFSEFRNQFRELCRGEKYTPVLEMAQLKTKLPKDALTTIAGLQCPEEAWKRLEELYGNRELSILSALKALRDFKPVKTAPHEVVIELVSAVQRCLTELGNVKARDEFLNDRESLACVVFALPPTVRDKWYDREVPEETRPKGEYLLKWLELQRQNAVRVRLDTMAARLRIPPAHSSAPGRSSHQGESTDKGLVSSSMHAQGVDKPSPNPPAPQGAGVGSGQEAEGRSRRISNPSRRQDRACGSQDQSRCSEGS